MQGWIKLHRCLMNKPIWLESTPEQKVILITLLTMANHQGREWEWKGESYRAEPGQFITSLPSIVQKCGKGITLQNVRTSLKRFEKYEFLTDESTNKNRLITIVNWGFYQESEDETNSQTNRQLTGNQQATNRQLTSNKNDKNVKNDKNENKKNSRKRIYDISSIHFQLAERLFKRIQENNPDHKQPDLHKWANDIRLMMESDKRTEEQIIYVIDWCQKNSFWKSNILSVSKLREKYDQLVSQIKSARSSDKPIKKPEYPKEEKDHARTDGGNTNELGNVRLFK